MTTMHGKGEKEMKKVIVLITVFACAFMLLGLVATASGESTEPKLEILAGNLSFEDSVALLYAVNVTGADADKAEMLYWTAPKGANDLYTKGTENYSSSPIADETVDEKECKVFRYDYLFAKEMTDYIYSRAYITVGGQEYYSSVVKYSVLEYAYNMLGYTAEGSDDENLHKVLNNMLEYGASVQEYKNYKADRLATDRWYKVQLTAGTLDDGFAHGLYLPGDNVTLTAPLTDADGATFTSWVNSKGAKVGTTPIFELTVTDKNEVYTPVYVKYSSGFDFYSNEDGTCCIDGMGTCEDTVLRIPPISPSGDLVVEISGSAFAGEGITAVYFPSTIEMIGSRAFNNCTSLADVYYDGTEEEWNENVTVGSRNTPLDEATMHFNEPTIETFTVTFVDHDGTVLKTETVESGKSATPPQEPIREGYNFIGWDKAYNNVTTDLTVTAEYEKNYSSPTFVVRNVVVNAGDTITVAINVKNNPGILAMTLSLAYDESVMELVSATNGEALSTLTMTPSKTLSSGCKFAWDGVKITEEDIIDGEILVLTFAISESAVSGSYDIVVSYTEGDIYDNDINPLSFEIENGTVTIK